MVKFKQSWITGLDSGMNIYKRIPYIIVWIVMFTYLYIMVNY